MSKILISLKNFLLDLFFPKTCLNCGKEGNYLCSDCQALIEITTSQYCPGCQKITIDGKPCKNCKKSIQLNRLYFSTFYKNQIVKKLITKFKYEPFCKELAKPLANLIIIHFQLLGNFQNLVRNWDLVLIPVPLDKKRLKWRGFNQAEELAKELSLILKLPVVGGNLIKIKKTPPQVDLEKNLRIQNLNGVFSIKNKEKIKGKKILLVDDVYTTGSTLNQCAKILKEAGAKEVWGVTVARE